MIIADVKGKLTMQEKVSEDFLTSTVFSAFKYLDDKWITKFLSQAVNIKEEKLDIEINDLVYKFWPNYKHTTNYGGGCEPDLIIEFGDKAIIIEAKNYAGKSGEGTINKGDREDIILSDQLGREYFVGRDIINKNYSLIYLTRDNVFPEKEIKESIQAITEIDNSEKYNAENKIYWLNWFKARDIFEEILQTYSKKSFSFKISEDLILFLERRDIRTFKGFDFLNDNYGFSIINDSLFYNKTEKKFWTWINTYINIFQTFNFKETKNIFYESEGSNSGK